MVIHTAPGPHGMHRPQLPHQSQVLRGVGKGDTGLAGNVRHTLRSVLQAAEYFHPHRIGEQAEECSEPFAQLLMV